MVYTVDATEALNKACFGSVKSPKKILETMKSYLGHIVVLLSTSEDQNKWKYLPKF